MSFNITHIINKFLMVKLTGSNAVNGSPNVSRVVRVNDKLHPEYQGSNIYGLTTVIVDGVPHLVGTISKAAIIYDFTANKVVYDFSDFGGEPRSGGDSYNATAFWKGKYYFGGWIIAPHPAGSSLNLTNKYTYLIATSDLKNWEIIIKDKAPDSASWQAEISDLVPTENYLYILRGDSAGNGTGTGLWRYNGTTVSKISSSPEMKANIFRDKLYRTVRGSSSVSVLNLITNTEETAISYASIPSKGGGSAALDGGQQGAMGHMFGTNIIGTKNGFISSAGVFVPLFISSITDKSRTVGWRSKMIEVNGGLVMPVNEYDIGAGGAGLTSALVYFGSGGNIRVLDTGKYFGGLEIFNDKLYYGTSASAHYNDFYNYQQGNPTLGAIDLNSIPSLAVPYQDRIFLNQYNPSTSGVNGVLGGYPTLGYNNGKLILSSGNAITVTFKRWDLEMDPVNVGTETIQAGQTKIIDLKPYMTGGLLGFAIDVGSFIHGEIAFW